VANSSEIISIDDHVQEPPDLWTSRVPKKFADRAPRLIADNGTQAWVADGQVLLNGNVSDSGALQGDRNASPQTWDEVPSAAYSPADRLKVMDAGGIDRSVLYPTVAGLAGEAFGRFTDGELELACVQAYNDWIIDEWAKASDRFIPLALVPLGPPEATIKEIERAVKLGHRGVIFPSMPMLLRDVPPIADAIYDPVWDACEQLDIPVSLHAGASPTLQYAPYSELSQTLTDAIIAVEKPVGSVFTVSMVSFSKLLLRHPKLQLVYAESALSWGMLFLEWADHQFEHDGLWGEDFELNPSGMFRRQCFFTTWFDRVNDYESYIGADSIAWSANLPQASSKWPRTTDEIERSMAGLSAVSREKVLTTNAAKLYKINVA
jgi:predicted TIM-barrel fold metal-dependent hydrolase